MDRRTLLISTAAVSISALGSKAVFETAHAQTKAATATTPPASQISAYMGAPVKLGKAPNGAIANKKLLDVARNLVETLCEPGDSGGPDQERGDQGFR